MSILDANIQYPTLPPTSPKPMASKRARDRMLRDFEPMVVSETVTVSVKRKHLYIEKHLTNERDEVSIEVLGRIPVRYLKQWSRESSTANSVLVVELPGPGPVDVLEHWKSSIATPDAHRPRPRTRQE